MLFPAVDSFFSVPPGPTRSPLFPYTTLFRSDAEANRRTQHVRQFFPQDRQSKRRLDRKSTRLNSSHANTSYAVFCLKKKKPRRTRRTAPSTSTPRYTPPTTFPSGFFVHSSHV